MEDQSVERPAAVVGSNQAAPVAWQDLREEGQPAFVDRHVPEEPVQQRLWPQLTPAGIQPQVASEEVIQRPRV